MTINFNNVEFVKSAANAGDLIQSSLKTAAFAGKSNVGKSSVINRVLNRSGVARVGSKPGKTVHINYFMVDKKALIADLPGYGYAEVAKSERDRWAKLCEAFFAQCNFNLGVFIVDSRHKPTADDITMANWFRETGVPVVVVANKADKISKAKLEENLKMIESALNLPNAEILGFSAETGYNRQALVDAIIRGIS